MFTNATPRLVIYTSKTDQSADSITCLNDAPLNTAHEGPTLLVEYPFIFVFLKTCFSTCTLV